MARPCLRVYMDPDETSLIDLCDREAHEGDPIHRGRNRDLEWIEEDANVPGGRRSRHTSGTKTLRRAGISEPQQPLPLD